MLMKYHGFLLCPTQHEIHPFVCCMYHLPISHLVAQLRSAVMNYRVWAQVTFILLHNGPNIRTEMLAIWMCQRGVIQSYI